VHHWLTANLWPNGMNYTNIRARLSAEVGESPHVIRGDRIRAPSDNVLQGPLSVVDTAIDAHGVVAIEVCYSVEGRRFDGCC
jgi:hypothetical protein